MACVDLTQLPEAIRAAALPVHLANSGAAVLKIKHKLVEREFCP